MPAFRETLPGVSGHLEAEKSAVRPRLVERNETKSPTTSTPAPYNQLEDVDLIKPGTSIRPIRSIKHKKITNLSVCQQ